MSRTSTTSRPVPTRNNGRTLPAEWRLRDIDELSDRLADLGVDADTVTAWLPALADRGARNPARYTRNLTDGALLADVRHTIAALNRAGVPFAGRLDYDRNYSRSPRLQPWGGGPDAA